MNQKKIGTLFGVIVPNITMMFGVILFLRLGVVVSHSGLAITLSVIGFSLLIMLITSVSTATIATNMNVGGGGVYYLITRSLGIEIGGALGFGIFLSQLLGITMTISAFAYTAAEIFPFLNVTIVEAATLIILALLSSTSASIALRAQGIILIILLVAVASIFFGSAEGIHLSGAASPFFPGGKLGFWQAFAILYPALTGIEAGMALSGNLKNPSRSLLYGNIISLIFVALTYMSVVIYAYFYIPHEALLTDPFVFINYATPGWFVTVGICAATLSSALGSLLGAPRILQSMAEDELVPEIFAKTFGPYQEPRWALLLTAIISLIVMVSTNIDQIIPVYAMVCLISYGLLNITAGLAGLVNAPSWRPRFNPPYVISLAGAILTIIAMFMIDPGWSFIAIFIIVGFYLLIRRKSLETSFQDMRTSLLFYFARYALYRLEKADSHAFSWHPQLIVLSVSPTSIPKLVWLSGSLTLSNGLLTFASVVPDAWETPERLESNREALKSYFTDKKIKCITATQTAASVYQGYINLVKAYGIGKTQPNTVVMPVNSPEDIDSNFLDLVKSCFYTGKNLLLYKASDSIDEERYTHFSSEQKMVDLWWDSSQRNSCHLMVSYVTSLRDSAKWKNAMFRLNVILEAKEAEEPVAEFLNNFVHQSRLKMDIAIHRQANFKESYMHVPDVPSNADLSFQPMRPYDESISDKQYKQYLKEILKYSAFLRSDCLFVANYDGMDHSEIYSSSK